jgi:error-prone DNA polymerase
MPLAEHVVADYQTTRLSLKAHPMSFLRERFRAERGACPAPRRMRARDAAFVKVAGVVLVRQRPGKGNAIFMTIEDETGICNILIWARNFKRFRREVMSARLALVEGRVQRSEEGVVHVIASRMHDRTAELGACRRHTRPSSNSRAPTNC